MTDELLDQLQTNYDRLLEKHALAENVIDSLRLGAKLQIHQDVTPNTIIQQVILVFYSLNFISLIRDGKFLKKLNHFIIKKKS